MLAFLFNSLLTPRFIQLSLEIRLSTSGVAEPLAAWCGGQIAALLS